MSWEVTNQRPDQIRQDQAGNTTTGVIVSFRTGAGRESSVFIDDSQYSNVDAVRTALDGKAALVDQIGTLKSDDMASM